MLKISQQSKTKHALYSQDGWVYRSGQQKYEETVPEKKQNEQAKSCLPNDEYIIRASNFRNVFLEKDFRDYSGQQSENTMHMREEFCFDLHRTNGKYVHGRYASSWNEGSLRFEKSYFPFRLKEAGYRTDYFFKKALAEQNPNAQKALFFDFPRILHSFEHKGKKFFLSKFEIEGKAATPSGFELAYHPHLDLEGEHFLIQYRKGSDKIFMKAPEQKVPYAYQVTDRIKEIAEGVSSKIFLNQRTIPFLLQAARNPSLKEKFDIMKSANDGVIDEKSIKKQNSMLQIKYSE